MRFLISVLGLLFIVFNSYSQKYWVYWENNVGFNSCSTGGSVVTQMNLKSWKRYNGCSGGLIDTLTGDGISTTNALPLALNYNRYLRIYSISDGRPSICSFSLQYRQELRDLDFGKIKHYIINDNADPGFSCSFSGSNVSGGVDIGISPPQPISVVFRDSSGFIESQIKRKTIILSNYYNSGDYNTTNNIKSNFTYEIQNSSNNGSTWNTICSGQPLDGIVSYTLPDVVSGFRDTLLFRSRIYRTNGVSPVDYSPWSIPKPFTVCDFPDVTITPTFSKCVGVNGGTTTIQFNVGAFDSYLDNIDIFSLTTKDGVTLDDTLVNIHTIKAGGTYASLPMAAATYAIKIRAKDIFFKILPITYTINQPPAAPAYSSGSLTPCVGSTQTYTVTGVGVDSYKWEVSSDLTLVTAGNTNSETVKFGSTLGSKTITVTPLNSCITADPKTLTINLNVNPYLPASVNIVASPTGAVCAGTSVTFTATPTNGGTAPIYQWYVNGSPVGTNSNTYTFIPTNGQAVKCVMTSNATPCLTGSPATSNTITTSVNPLLPASVSISASPVGAVCTGTYVTFTATPTNGGAAPLYQWKVNGSPVGTNSNTYTFVPTNGQTVTCTMTSNATPCLTGSPAPSNAITMTVNPFLPASVSISASPMGAVCTGTSVTFTATPTNGGSAPVYQWKVNGSPVGTNSNTYTFIPTNGQIVSCVMTSNATPCLTGSPAASNNINMTVSPVSVGGNISSNQIICYNDTPQSLILSGNTGTVLKWKQSTDPSFTSYTEFNETSNTLSGISIGSLIATTYFRAVVKSGVCSVTESSTATITVNPSSVGGSIAPQNQPVCYGNIPSNLTLSEFTGNIVKWQKSSNSSFSPSTDIVGVSPSLNGTAIGSLTSKTYFRAVVKSGVCPESYSDLAITNVNPLPNAVAGIDRSICFGSSTTIGADAVVGSTYSWTSNPSGFTSNLANPTVSPTVATTYTVVETITATGCSKSNSVTVTINSKPILGSPSLTNIDCYGSSTGQIAITASGGTSPYSYRLTGGGITPKVNANGLFTNLPAANNYSITVTDNNGCTATAGSITLTQPAQFILTVSGSGNPTCPGGSNGWVDVSASGGTPPYSFSKDGTTWIPASSPYRFGSLIAGSYTFRVKDAKGCEVTTASYTISQPNPITPTAIITNVTCKGESSGKLSLSVTGGTGLYTLTLTGPNSYSQTINSVALTANFSGLAKGTYNLIITDAVGCTKSVDYTINEPSLSLTLITSNTLDPSCNSFTNGQVELSASGGWGSYNYTLLPNVANNTTGTFTGLGKGSYNFEVVDAMGCTANASAMLGEPDLLVLSTPTITNLLCNGDGTGKISISAAGGTSPYEYNFGSGFSSQSEVCNLQANTYNITVKDSKGCVATSQATVNQPDVLQLNVYKSNHNGVNIKCFNGTDTVKVVPTGGTSPYTITFGGQNISCPINGYTLQDLAKGDYNITVTDSHNCTYSTIFTLTEPALFTLDAIDVDSALCNGTATGKVDIALKGGIPSYSFDLLDSKDDVVSQGNGVNHLFTGLASGSYTVNAVDGNGCKFTIQDIVYQPEPITVNFNVTNVSCFGYADGNAEAKITGGTIPYTCRWIGENGTEISQTPMISDAKEFDYHFLLTDKNGCSSGRGRMGQLDTLVKISNPKFPLSLNASIAKVLCHGESTGEINFEGTGGWNRYSYSINNEPFYANPKFSGLVADVYSSRIRDSLGCVVQKDFTVDQNDTLTFTTSTLDATCFGEHSGQVHISAMGGSPSYTYLIDDKTFIGDTTTLGAGSYTLKVSDMYSCVIPSQTVTIGSPTQIGFSAIVVNSNCNKSNGKIEITPSGGVAPYSVDWYQGGTVIFSGNTITNQPSGLYNFRITDGHSCIKDFSHNLPDDGSPTITLNSNVKTFCPGSSDGSISLSVDSGVLPYNVYLLNGSTELDARSYPTKPSEISFTGLNENKYSVKIIDGNGCQVIEQYDVESPLKIAATATTTNISCYNGNNGTALLAVSGGTSPYQIKWINSANQQIGTEASIENLSAGYYTYQVNDNHGCPFIPVNLGVSNSITINAPSAPLKASINTISNVLCYQGQDGAVQLTAQGGWGNYRFSIDLGATWKVSPNFTKLKAGDYRFLLTDNLGCTDIIDVKVNDGTPLNINIDELSDVTCYGTSTGKLTLSASGGGGSYSFSVNDGLTYTSNRYFTGLAYGNYPLRVKDINGCEGSSKQKIEQPQLLVASINQVANTACNKSIGSATAIATGGTLPYSYRWSNGQLKDKAVNLAYGSYSVEITDKNGCKNSTTTSIQNLPGPKLTLLYKNDATCSYLANGSITTSLSSGTAPITLTWRGTNSNSTSVSNLKKGIYTAIATDYYGCRDSVTVNIAKPDSLMISLKKRLDPVCYAYSNGILDIASNGGTPPYTYQWSNGSRVSSTGEIPSGKYTVTVTDGKGCETKTSYTLVDPPLLKPNLPSLITICSNQTYYADAGVPNASYQWYSENGFQSTTKTVSLSASGIYNLLVIDSKGCSGRDTLNLVKSENIIDANFMIADKAYVGDTLVLIEMSWPIPQSIEWQYPASFMPIYHNDYSVYLVPQMVGSFSIGLTSIVGPCSEYIEKIITVEPAKNRKNEPISKQPLISDVVAYPNPNRGDFSVEIALNRESDVLVEVYSTYGKRLFARNGKCLTNYKIEINLFQTPGIYLVRISAGNEFKSLRVVVE